MNERQRMWLSGAVFGVLLIGGTWLLFEGDGGGARLAAATAIAAAFAVPFLLARR